MGFSKREIPVSSVARTVYCGKCEQGWREIETGDPMYPTAFRACTCNARGQQIISEYRNYLYGQSWFSEGERQSNERIKATRAAKFDGNPSKDEIGVASVRSLFYVPPSERSGPVIGSLKDKLELAKYLHADKTKTWGVSEWEQFGLDHPDARKELDAVVRSEHEKGS